MKETNVPLKILRDQYLKSKTFMKNFLPIFFKYRSRQRDIECAALTDLRLNSQHTTDFVSSPFDDCQSDTGAFEFCVRM
jgi:hypothetical protein